MAFLEIDGAGGGESDAIDGGGELIEISLPVAAGGAGGAEELDDGDRLGIGDRQQFRDDGAGSFDDELCGGGIDCRFAGQEGADDSAFARYKIEGPTQLFADCLIDLHFKDGGRLGEHGGHSQEQEEKWAKKHSCEVSKKGLKISEGGDS